MPTCDDMDSMSTRKKITLILIGVFTLLSLVLMASILLNFREFGIKSAEEKAELTAEIVKSGLTSHMVNGVMDKRKYFLKKIENSKNMNGLWISRSRSIIEQFGDGIDNELPRDNIDREVLRTGKIFQKVSEDFDGAELRVTIPYIASSKGTPNCLKCHNVNENEVLGTISMVIDISDIRENSLVSILYIAIISILAIILTLFIINNSLRPYIRIFDSVKDVMQKVSEGDYSQRVIDVTSIEGKQVADRINGMLKKLQDALNELEDKVGMFLLNKSYKRHNDPLIAVKEIINELSDIYKFKKTIELDENLDEIYKRIAQILQYKFNLQDFNIIEKDTKKNSIRFVHVQKNKHCLADKNGCRADRTKATVNSSSFQNICSSFNSSDDYGYLCLPFAISDDLTLIISIISHDIQEKKRVDSLPYFIADYINTARSEIVSVRLNYILKESARRDQLTGLYNRKFLDEFIDKSIPQAKRSNLTYGILMVDIDHFKMINDTYGHDVGDEAIRIISSVIQKSIRGSDIAIRFGGEEFLILLYNCDDKYIAEVASKIGQEFAKQEIKAKDEVFSKTLSIGASMYPKDSEDIHQCIKFADLALYSAKNSGRNRAVRFEPAIARV